MSSPERELYTAFYDADEVDTAIRAFDELTEHVLRSDGRERKSVHGPELLYLLRDTLESKLTYRQKPIFQLLTQKVERSRTAMPRDQKPENDGANHVLISGAGPCGLRAAVEAAMLGFNVVVVDKRSKFSRANILTLWSSTCLDLVSLGSKYFYPKMQTHGLLHLGTREIQLVLLKAALMFGVQFRYGHSLIGLGPSDVEGRWAAKIERHKSSSNTPSSLLDAKAATAFKPNKQGFYKKTYKCNALEEPEVDEKFVNLHTTTHNDFIPFGTLLVAEGEWSTTTRSLGFKKTVDKFGLAMGLVINLKYDTNDAKQRSLQSFCSTLIEITKASPIMQLESKYGIKAETFEYLKGSNHYIVACIRKETLLAKGALREDQSNISDLLAPSNIDMQRLSEIARNCAQLCGLDNDVEFFDHNPIQLFDFSTRARCLSSVKILKAGPSEVQVVDGQDYRIAGQEKEKTALVIPIGDSLLEPYWPQGLGVNRGFHTSLNGVYSALMLRDCGIECAMSSQIFANQAVNFYSWGTVPILTPPETWSSSYTSRFNPTLLDELRRANVASQQ